MILNQRPKGGSIMVYGCVRRFTKEQFKYVEMMTIMPVKMIKCCYIKV